MRQLGQGVRCYVMCVSEAVDRRGQGQERAHLRFSHIPGPSCKIAHAASSCVPGLFIASDIR